ncbi:MAG: L-threonylcarbamoyladenylate synthase [Halobacteriales archaeon]
MRRVTVEEAAKTVSRGGVVVYPTETVYGVGADAFNDEAVQRVYEVKERPRDKPVSVAVADTDSVDDVARLDEEARRFAEEFLPGPVTLLAPRRDAVPDPVTAGGELVGVRVPDDETALRLLRKTGALTSTSANISGEASATSVEELGEVGDRVDGVIDDGARDATGGEGSTVVDTTTWEVVREGTAVERVHDYLNRNGL